jgi:hypothetical protein
MSSWLGMHCWKLWRSSSSASLLRTKSLHYWHMLGQRGVWHLLRHGAMSSWLGMHCRKLWRSASSATLLRTKSLHYWHMFSKWRMRNLF